jgi:hypothetical protein
MPPFATIQAVIAGCRLKPVERIAERESGFFSSSDLAASTFLHESLNQHQGLGITAKILEFRLGLDL